MEDKDFIIKKIDFSVPLKLPKLNLWEKFTHLAKRIVYYIKIWLLMSKNSFLVYLNQKTLLLIFLFGKVVRFVSFFLFLFFLLKGTNNLAGYNLNQTIFFYLTFNIVDVISQFIFREVYRFRPLLVSGDFDLVLVKPQSALFRVLMGGADVIDLITIPPLFYATFYIGEMLNPSFWQTILYIFLLINSLIIATSFYIAVLGLGIITLEIDNTVMLYRDVSKLGIFPVDIYKQPIKAIVTFLIPIGIMVTLPAKVLMGLVSAKGVVTAFLIAALFLFIALRFWKYALRFYTSASS
jgi:ABC-2 type transport system permease protein